MLTKMQLNLKTTQKLDTGAKIQFSSNAISQATAMKHTFLRGEDTIADGDMEQYVIIATNTNDLIILKDRQIMCSVANAHNQDITQILVLTDYQS